ncbi:hypothetical protein HII31_01285 [Pseudocercospora fuligena]|uniref:Uncharacterized protein n=1 Tax=Pseudocercospora fuligena TaxID=685502 RepID=A0A8H6RT63_9PEZI|nr:hypothetical protein HII31_01285 [Pseudocercospora fuligena]
MDSDELPASSADGKGEATTSTTESEPTSALESRLESIVLELVRAINDRNIGPDAPVWNNFQRDLFRAEVQGPAFTAAGSHMETNAISFRGERNTVDLDQFIELRRHICTQYPDHSSRLIRMDTILGDKGRSAQIMVYAEVTGIPEGFTRPTMGMFDFMLMGKLKEGKWKVVKLKTFPGMALSDGI